MSLLDKRNNNQDNLILEKRFIRTVLKEEGQDLLKEQSRQMNRFGFSSRSFYADRKIDVTDTMLKMDHLAKHRFVDMKRRETKQGVKKKKSYPIHNRLLFGYANNVVRRISFGFTEETIEMMRNIKDS